MADRLALTPPTMRFLDKLLVSMVGSGLIFYHGGPYEFPHKLLWCERHVLTFYSIIDSIYPPQRRQRPWEKTQDPEFTSKWALSAETRPHKATEDYLVLLGAGL